MTLVEWLGQLADNTHLGKIVTDLAPGIILTLTILLLISAFTDLQVFPYASAPEHRERSETVRGERAAVESEVELLQGQVDGLEAQLRSRPPEDEHQRATAELAKAEKALSRKADELARLNLKLEEEETAAADALLLDTNLKTLTDHFIALFIAGYFVGVVLAQVSGKLFYNGHFYSYLRKNYPSVDKKLHPKNHQALAYLKSRVADQAVVDALPNLETEYFRYLEVAMNMILPFGALTLTLAAIAVSVTIGVGPGAAVMPLALAVACLGVTLTLFYNARVLYVGYSIRKAELVTALEQKLAAQEAAAG